MVEALQVASSQVLAAKAPPQAPGPSGTEATPASTAALPPSVPTGAAASSSLTTLQEVLAGDSVAAQANLLLELSEHLAERKPVSSVVSDVCRILIASGKGSSVIKRLAYDAVSIAALHHEDCVYLCQGIDHDLSPEEPAEVQQRVLEAVAHLPELHVDGLLRHAALEERLLVFLREGTPDAQSAAALALAHVYSRPLVAEPLFTDPSHLASTMDHWVEVVDACGREHARVVHGALVAIDYMLKAHVALRGMRDGEADEARQCVIGHLAWCAAVRVRARAAHVLAKLKVMPASMQADGIAVLLSTIELLMTRDPPPRIDSTGHLRLVPDPSAPPVAASDGWASTALGNFCATLLDAPDAAVATEAARAVLHLQWLHTTVKFPRMHAAPPPEHWTRAAFTALLRVGSPLDAIAGREAAAATACRYLCLLPHDVVTATAKVVLQWVLTRSSASSRVSNLMLLWRALVDCDLAAWRRRMAAGGGEAAPAPSVRPHAQALIDALEEPLVRALRAGDSQDLGGGKNVSPTLNQEVVATLLEVLLTHDGASAAVDLALRPGGPALAPEAATDLPAAVEAAAVHEARLTALEWGHIALVALQGTQGCLGWDHKREKKQGSYPATVTSDKWFVLASRAQHTLVALRACADFSAAALVASDDPGAADTARQHLEEAIGQLQVMLLKTLRFWRSLSPASMPRALWVIVHHVRLPAILDEQWDALLSAARELLLFQPLATVEMHIQELEMSTRAGALPYSTGAQGLKARDRPLLFGGHLLHMPEATDWWDACAEGLAMAAAALDRICQLLYANYAAFAHLDGYQRLVAAVAAILEYATTALPDALGVQVTIGRLLATMRAVAAALPEEAQEIPEDALYEVIEAAAPSPRSAAAAAAASGALPPLSRPQKKPPRLVLGPGGEPLPLPLPTLDAAAPPSGTAEAQRGGIGRRLFGKKSRQGDGPSEAPQGAAGGPPRAAAAAAGAAGANGRRNGGAAAGAAATTAQGPLPGDSSDAVREAPAAPSAIVKPMPAMRSSNVLMAGAKGFGNRLGIRRKGAGKPSGRGSAAGPMGEGDEGGGGDSAMLAPAAGQRGRRHVFQAPAPVARAAPAPPANHRRTASGAAAQAIAMQAAATGAARPAPPPPGGPHRAAGASSQDRLQRLQADLLSVEPAAAARAAPGAGRRVVSRKYIGPYLEPLRTGGQPPEGFPFGAPVSGTLADAVRTKRHVVFESQLTSSQQALWEAYRDPSTRPEAAQTLADLLATVGTLPAPMQLARSIDPASVPDAAGAAVLAVAGRFVEVTSGHEPLRLFASASMDWAAMQVVLTLRAQSMLSADMTQLSVKVQVLGPASWIGMSGWNVSVLPALESTSQTLRLAVAGSGALTLQPAVTHRMLRGASQEPERLEVPTAPLRIPITLQLKAPRVPLSPDAFFQRFHTWHHSCTVSGTCKWAGAKGGLAVLDVIEKKPFRQVYLQLLPALGGYQAGYLAYDTTNRAIGLLLCAQLVTTLPGLKPLTAAAADMAAVAHVLIRVTAHTASAGAVASMAANPAHWLRELTDGAVTPAVAVVPAISGSRPPPLSNKYAHLAVQYLKDLTPDEEEEAAATAAAEAAAAAAEGDEGEKGKKGRREKKGMQEAAKGLAALAHAVDKKKQSDEEAAAAAAAAAAAEGGDSVAAGTEDFVVEEVSEQTGEDWLHMAVLSQWQQMRDAAVRA